MAFDAGTAERLRDVFSGRRDVVEKEMFGGLAFMVRGHMCCGIVGDELMARVGPNQYADALRRPHAREMDFTGKPMVGFVYVAPPGFESDEDLRVWVTMCERYVLSLPEK
jgi:hypothetical protein